MKYLSFSLLCSLVLLVSACAHFPTATRTLATSASLSSEQLLELAIEAAREVGLPPVTKLDKANGVVEFGAFGMPELGVTGQARVRADQSVEITLKRGSVYVPLSVEDTARKFTAALESKLEAFSQPESKATAK